MRLRPVKGEGERSKSFSKKGPLLITTALLVGYPVCVAQAVTTYSALGLPTQYQQQTAKSSWLQSQPKSYLSLKSLASLPSNQDLIELQSTLEAYEYQLSILKRESLLDPALLPELSKLISGTEAKISSLSKKIETLKSDLAATQLARNTLTSALKTLNDAIAAESLALLQYEAAKVKQANNSTILSQARSANEQALRTLNESRTSTQTAQDVATASNTAKLNHDAVMTQAQQALQQQQQATDRAQANLNAAQQTLNEATSAYSQAQANLNQAQSNYDTKLIPDPTWTPPTYQKENTRLVPYTELQLVRTLVPRTTYITEGGVKAEVFNRQGYNNAPPLPTANEVPIHTTTVQEINFNWGSGNILGSNRSEDVIVRFTGNIMVPQDGYYQFYSPADDGTKLEIAGMNLTEDWYDKGGGGTISDPVFIRAGILYPFTLHYYENGGGAAVGLFTYSPQQGFSVVPSTWLGTSVREETTYEEVITYEEVTKYREEIYYTTEPVLVQGSLEVKINEGGEATFTAPEGTTFTGSNLRYEAIQRPQCGIDINPPVQGQTQVTISASNGVWGDPCGGWYKHITGTISYLGQPTAPLIKDPSLLPALQQAQADLVDAENDLDLATTTFNEVDSKLDAANSQLQTAQNTLSTETQKSQELQTSNEAAQQDLAAKQETQRLAQQTYDESVTSLSGATSNEATSKAEEDQAAANYLASQEATSDATSNKTAAETELAKAEASATTSNEDVLSEPRISFTAIEDLLKQEPPKPEPEEEGSAEIPAVIENLMDVDLNAVDPTELTEAQAEQLVVAALEAFETAEEGSAEYEQALDALFLAAQQDDIQVDPALEAIPGVGQAAAAVVAIFNIVGNVGADISPEKRKEAQTLVVTTLVVGQIAQAAAMASASSGGSFRRK
jgi:hypothetical protein